MTTDRPHGFFITLEGIEGAGKSTHATYIKELVQEKGHDCLVTREPGGTGTGEQIRKILLYKNDLAISPLSELLLMFAARAQHIAEVILPALQQGKIVICD
ncbi:MAG TPA: dTMP kinase, partial [Gammaproteobacteria bacterium]|nr:dTMP kinase [Gammaproteobacteria bacterium]